MIPVNYRQELAFVIWAEQSGLLLSDSLSKLSYLFPNVSSIYDVTTKGINVPQGRALACSVYAVRLSKNHPIEAFSKLDV